MSLAAHLVVFAAERARRTGVVATVPPAPAAHAQRRRRA
jgi:hypothetical protein